MKKRIGYLPRNEKEAKQLAAMLTLLDVNYRIGFTCGKGQPLIDVELGLIERALVSYGFIGIPKMQNYNYYLLKEVAH